MHINKGKTIAQCITDRTGYAINPDKTNNGELISCYACDYRTVDAEFAFAKRQYKHITGKEEMNDVITSELVKHCYFSLKLFQCLFCLL